MSDGDFIRPAIQRMYAANREAARAVGLPVAPGRGTDREPPVADLGAGGPTLGAG
jgi:hypothetical protein